MTKKGPLLCQEQDEAEASLSFPSPSPRRKHDPETESSLLSPKTGFFPLWEASFYFSLCMFR